MKLKSIILTIILFLGTNFQGCNTEINNPDENKRITIPFVEVFHSTFFLECAENYFYVINDTIDLETSKQSFINGTDEYFYNILKEFNYTDSTIIGSTTRPISGGAQFSTDSVKAFDDSIFVYYTLEKFGVYTDVSAHTSIVRIEKTDLPIKEIITSL